MQPSPFVSVIICSFNGASFIAETLRALEQQTYPKNDFEVIVVDDGSNDGTRDIARTFDVTVVRHALNRGVGASRNTGLARARGEIVAFTDDDCLPDRRWLANLIEPYRNANVMATGGQTVAVSDRVPMERYMDASGYGNPAPSGIAAGRTLFSRLTNYVSQMASPLHLQLRAGQKLHAVYTLNASYRAQRLRQIGGFDALLRASEDTDVSARLYAEFPQESIVYAKRAIVGHRHRSRYWRWARQNYARSQDTFVLARHEGYLPPLYPLPMAIILVALFASLLAPWASIAVLALSPLALYWWWHIRVEKWVDRLLFPYMQFILELSELLGYLTAFIRGARVSSDVR